MKSHDRFRRLIGLIMFLFGTFLIFLITIAMLSEGVFPEAWMFILFLEMLWICIAYAFLRQSPSVELTPEGVSSRVLFHTKHHSWSEIRQAGILYHSGGRGIPYNELILVTAKGSPRKYRDRWFLLRNPFALINITARIEEARHYVIQYYGPLDFDLSDGRSEQSIVVDD